MPRWIRRMRLRGGFVAADMLDRWIDGFAKRGHLASGVALAVSFAALWHSFAAVEGLRVAVQDMRREQRVAVQEARARDRKLGELVALVRRQLTLTSLGSANRYTMEDGERHLKLLANANQLVVPEGFWDRPSSWAHETLLKEAADLSETWKKAWEKWEGEFE